MQLNSQYNELSSDTITRDRANECDLNVEINREKERQRENVKKGRAREQKLPRKKAAKNIVKYEY